MTGNQAWLETSGLNEGSSFDASTDLKGPVTLGIALSRITQTGVSSRPTGGEQRVVVIGDGDFLSNTYIGNGGNMDLGLHIANWLSHDDQLLNIPVKPAGDVNFQLSKTMQMLIAFGFLIAIPLALAASGFGIWWQRRKR